MQQWYSCPQCRQYVQHGQLSCQYCGCRFNWPTAPKAENTGPFSKYWWINSPWAKIFAALILIPVIIGVVALASGKDDSKSQPTPQSPSITATEAAYASSVANNASKIGTAIDSIIEIFEDPDMGDSTWQVKVGARLGALQYWIKEARKMTPPPSMQAIHTKYTEGLDHYYNFADLMDQAVKTVDQTYVTKAMTEFKAGTTCINETTEMLSEFNTGIK